MLKNEDIICISSIDWDFVWQGHQEIMTRLARNGNRVLFIENTCVRPPKISDIKRIKTRISNWKRGVHGIRKIEDGLYIYSPLVLPFPYSRLARAINKHFMFSVLFKWLKTVGFSNPVVWVFLPTGLSLDLINKIDYKILIYYCIDSFQASSEAAKKIKKTEELMIKTADLVFVTSQELEKYCGQYSRSVHFFPFGVNIEKFNPELCKKSSSPEDIDKISKPIIGYIGGIHKWIDFDLIIYIAERNKDISFVFCGPIQTDIGALKDMKNVFFLGQKKADELPLYIKDFDAAIIPYKIAEYTKNVYPTKLNEYLAMGKSVISTMLPEVVRFESENPGSVFLAETREEFSEKINDIITRPGIKRDPGFLMGIAAENSWAIKVEKMSQLIEAKEAEKLCQKEASWMSSLNIMFRKAGNKFIPAFLSAVVIYFLLFHTPFIWLLASPLKINDMPKKADVIVVLGGGVGESGKVGQGYQERVDTAVKLYNKDLGKKIIYMSGYSYIMKEANVMKTLSVSLGVNEANVIIDELPVNTYDMVMNLKQLALKNGWKDINIISAPYHMLRLKFLCDKHLKELNVSYIPVESSQYYAKGNKITLHQIEGILKEYTAILFYKLKRYI